MSDTIADQNIAGTPPPGSKRERIAIAFADIVGYSRLMGADETRTYAAWMEVLSRLLRPEAEKAQGRIVQVMGDGVLTEFGSTADAIGWAEAVQRGLREHPALAADDTPLALRIAIHLGEVTRNGGNIFGDDVNTAARLQDYAEPGGILLSAAARAELGQHWARPMRDLGYLALKNIDRPVQGFAVGPAAPPAATPAGPAGATLPSIAVLPFRTPPGDTEDAYFAEGVVEDIVVSLAGLRELVVIARSSAAAASAPRRDVREIGGMLGARYVLSGNVTRRGERVRVAAELAETTDGVTLWVERAEGPTAALFDLQDRLVERVVAGLAPQLRSAELQRALRKRPGSITAYDWWLRAIDLMGSLDRERFLGARTTLDRSLEADPHFAMAAAWSAQWCTLAIGQAWAEDTAAIIDRAVGMARRALAADPGNALALALTGHLHAYLLRDPAGALAHFEAALAACPNLARAWMYSAATLSYLGRGGEAVAHAERAMRLSPMDQWRFQFSCFRGLAHYANNEPEAAVHWLSVSFAENPNYISTPKLLTAASAASGRIEAAQEAARLLLEREPGFRIEPYMRDRQPFRDRRVAERYRNDLVRAGLPG